MFKLTLATPEKAVFVGKEIKEITLPGHSGELNILSGHAPMVTTLESGVVKIVSSDGSVTSVSVSWGYCEVAAEEINLLAEIAVSAEEINLIQLKSEREEAEKAIASGELDEQGFEKYFTKLREIEAQEGLANSSTLH